MWVLCLNCVRQQHPVINIVITGNLAAVVSIQFNNLRKIVIDRIKFKILLFTPFDSFQQSVAGTTGPENELVAISSPFLEIRNQCQIGRTAVWPFAITKCAIKIYGNGFEINCVIIHGLGLLWLVQGWYSYIRITDLPNEKRNLQFSWQRVALEDVVPFQY